MSAASILLLTSKAIITSIPCRFIFSTCVADCKLAAAIIRQLKDSKITTNRTLYFWGEKPRMSCRTNVSSPIFFTVSFFQRSTARYSNINTGISNSNNKCSVCSKRTRAKNINDCYVNHSMPYHNVEGVQRQGYGVCE